MQIMEDTKKKSIFRFCPLRLGLSLLAALLILLQRALRGNVRVMRGLSARFVRPVLRTLGEKRAGVSFSIAEISIPSGEAYLI